MWTVEEDGTHLSRLGREAVLATLSSYKRYLLISFTLLWTLFSKADHTSEKVSTTCKAIGNSFALAGSG